MAHGLFEQLLPEKLYSVEVTSRKDLLSRIGLARALIRLTQQAIAAFLDHDLRLFDALVGENRCEVRSLYLLQLYEEPGLRDSLQALDKALEDLARTMSQFEIESAPERVSLAKMLSDLPIPSMDEECQFLVVSYALCLARSPILTARGARSDPSVMSAQIPEMSSKAGKRCVRHWQRWIARKSVQLLAELDAGKRQLFGELNLADCVMVDAQQRPALPTVMGIRLICDRLRRKEKIRTILVVNIVTHGQFVKSLYLESTPASQELHWRDGISSPDGAAYVVEGCMHVEKLDQVESRLEIVRAMEFEMLFLASGSHKSDYPGGRNCQPGALATRLEEEKRPFQRIPGCSIHDPSLFCVVHVAAHSVRDLLSGAFRSEPRMVPLFSEER